jgi:hypothetical protein
LPNAVRVESRLDHEEGVIVPCASSRDPLDWGWESVPVTGETYLRLAEVNLDDPGAILAFVSQYGTLGGGEAHRTLTHATITTSSGHFFENIYGSQLDWDAEYEKAERSLFKEMKRADPDLSVEDGHWSSGGRTFSISQALSAVETLDEFRFAARCLRDLTSAWQMFRSGGDATEFEWVSLSASDHPELSDQWVRDGLLETDAFPRELLVGMLGHFLHDFSPQLIFTGTISASRTTIEPLNVEPKRGPTFVPLYAICALELFNHIIENAEYHTCGNDRCNRTFVHQQGRAEKGQRRSRGVIYCSPSCARATAQREYRRRRRARHGEGE